MEDEMIRKLSESDPESLRQMYKIVRRDYVDGGDVPGLIIRADIDTGLCLLEHKGEKKEYNFGVHCFAIVHIKG